MRLLIPPAAREATAGDLWERYRSPLQYASEALRILPFIIVSQARRGSDLAMLGLQTFILFACLGGFETSATGAPLWARAGIPTLAAFLGLLLRDVYRSTDERSIRRAVFDVVTAVVCALLAEGALAVLIAADRLNRDWMLAPQFVVLGTLTLPILCVLRSGHGLVGGSRLANAGGGMTMEHLARDYSQFARRVRWRNRAEIAALLLTIVGSAYVLVRFDPSVAPIGWGLVGGLASIAAYLAIRGSARRMTAGSSFVSLRTLYQEELARQHRIRRFMWWWWLAPLFAGLTTNLIIRGITSAQPLLTALGIALAVLLGTCIVSLNRDRGRKVHAKITLLGTVSEVEAT